MIQNTKNIEILRISIVLIFAICGGFLVSMIWKLEGALSYGAGFISFVCVSISLYIATQNKIKKFQNTMRDTQDFQTHQTEDKEEKMNFAQAVSLGIGLSFSFFRLLSYAILVGILLLLIKANLFEAYSYMIGIFVGLLGSLCFVLLSKKS